MASPVPVTTEPALRRVIGVRGLAAAIFNITIGAAIFVLPAHVAGNLGAAAPLAYLVCAVATALVALCIAEAGSRVPRSGGPYAYVETAFGPYAGYLCGVLLWLGITLAMGAVATVFADAALGLLPGLGGPLLRAALLIAVIAGLAVVNIRGAALGSRVSGIATVAKIVPLIAFVALGLSHVRAENLALGSFPSLARLGESGLLLMFAFFGMESALQVSGEVRDAARAVPRAIALAVTGVGVLYIAVQLVAQGILGSALAAPETAKAPLAAAAVQFAGPTGSTLILIAMIVSTFGFMTATMLSTPRTLFALAEDGYLPRPLAAVHRAHHTPYVAIAIQGVIVCAIAITGTYVKLAIMANVAILFVYLACCLGVWRLRRLDAGAADKPFVMPAGRVVPWVAAGLIVVLLARATAQAWLLTGGVMAAASLAFLARRGSLQPSGRRLEYPGTPGARRGAGPPGGVAGAQGSGQMTEAGEPWGKHAPRGVERWLIAFCRRLPRNWLGARLAVFLRHPVKYGPDTPLDVEVWGLRLRLHRRGNYSETALLFRPESFDPAERDVLKSRIASATVFLDLGANAGAYSFWAYNRLGPACRIVAVEPDPELYARLAFNIATNRASITPVRAALGDHPGRLPLFINPERRGQNSLLARPGASQPAESVVVDVMTLPDLLAAVAVDHVDVMKIDLEGMEYPVLHHFFQTAGRRLWPRVLVTEFKETEEHRRLLAELDALGYGVCARTRENVVLERS